MSRASQKFALRARYVFPVAGPPLADGVVSVDGSRIAGVGRNASRRPPLDLGNVALLPGLVNAHTHLEFSALREPLGTPGMPLPDWIRRVVEYRRRLADDPHAEVAGAVAEGLRQSLAAGTTTLGEIATAGWSPGPLDASPVRAAVFLELIGLGASGVPELLEAARSHLQLRPARPGAWWPGLSPHAPYSAHPELVAEAVAAANDAEAPLAMHLAETPEELELLQTGGGPFRALLEDLGAWDAAAIPAGTRPLDFLTLLAGSYRALVVHGNCLDNEEIAFLGQHAPALSVVYCPRTHEYFRHRPYPLAALLQAGANVALGTDSRASNPDLSMLEEMRHVARRHQVPLGEVLKLGTLNAARALDQHHLIGSLAPGHRADLCAVELPDRGAADPHELLLDSELPVVATYVGGVRVGE